MSIQLSKITPALFPMLVAALMISACSDSTAPSGDQLPSAGSPERAPASSQPASTAPNVVPSAAPASTTPNAPKPSFATRSSSWAAPGASPGFVQINPGAAYCSVDPTVRYVRVNGVNATVAGGVGMPFTQLVTADVDLYRWNGSTWVYQRTARSSIKLAGVTSMNPLPPAKFQFYAAGYYHIMVRMTWWADLWTGSWTKEASAVYAFDSQADYSGTFGAKPGPGYCQIY